MRNRGHWGEILEDKKLMWDALLYGVIRFYYLWLIKKRLWPVPRKSKQRYKEKEGRVRGMPGQARREVTSHEPVVKYRMIEVGQFKLKELVNNKTELIGEAVHN